MSKKEIDETNNSEIDNTTKTKHKNKPTSKKERKVIADKKKNVSLFAKDYRQIIKELKEEQAEIESKESKESSSKYEEIWASYIHDISDESVYPIDNKHMYKKTFAKKHNYKFPVPDVSSFQRLDLYSDLYEILPSTFEDNPLVDEDFLTGYFFAKWFMMPTKQIKSFHAGLSSDGINRGMFYAFTSSAKPIKWEFFGCDKNIRKDYAKHYVNGINNKCNLFDINTVRSINLQLSEKTKVLDIYIGDIRPNNLYEFLCQLILVQSYNPKYMIVRLPTDWKNNFTGMVNILLYLVAHYNVVKIFKTPWGIKPKWYLILSDSKENSNASKYTSLMKYIEELKQNPTLPLYSNMVFEVEELGDQELITQDDLMKPESYMKIFIENTQNLYKQLVEYEEDISSDDANKKWDSLSDL